MSIALGIGTSVHRAVQAAYEQNIKNLKKETKIRYKMWSGIKKAAPHFATAAKAINTLGKGFKQVTSFGFDMLGIILQLANSMGILQPILQMVQGIFSIMGGAAFETLGPVLEDLAEFLFSDEMVTFWQELGTQIGEFFKWMLGFIVELLGNPKIRELIKNLLDAIISIVTHLMKIFGGFFELVASWDIHSLGIALYALAIIMAFMKGVAAIPGPAGFILGAALAGIVAIALAPLAALQTGGYIPATGGGTIIRAGEGGEGEWVVPDSKVDSFRGSQEVLWATEDNGKKLDRLIGAMETANRINRMKGL
jgi:hypothetical protein